MTKKTKIRKFEHSKKLVKNERKNKQEKTRPKKWAKKPLQNHTALKFEKA